MGGRECVNVSWFVWRGCGSGVLAVWVGSEMGIRVSSWWESGVSLVQGGSYPALLCGGGKRGKLRSFAC